MMSPRSYTFDADQLCALSALLDLVHYDSLAQSYLDLLPEDLRQDMYDLVWMDAEEADCA